MIRYKWLALVCVVLLFTTAGQIGKSYRADRFDMDVFAQEDGSILVEESVTFRFVGGPFSFVFRELPVDRSDGITDIIAGADGVIWPRGTGPGQVEIGGSNPIEVVWHLSPTSNAVHTFTISYKQHGVVRSGEGADVLEWQALPDKYDYEIDNSRLTVHFPPAGTLLKDPEIVAGDALLLNEFDRATFEMQDLSPGSPLVVRLTFSPDSFSGAPPIWMAQQEAQNDRAWIWFVSTAAILIGGLFIIIKSARANTPSIPKARAYTQKPPADLPPALAGYLANQTVTWQHGLATLFDLASRGLIEIEALGKKSLFHSTEFTLTLLDWPDDLHLHEQSLLELLFIDKAGVTRDVVAMSEMSRLITSSRWKRFAQALEEEATSEGFIDPTAKQRRSRMIGWGVVMMVLSIPLLVGAFLLRDLFGAWPALTIGALFIVGFIAAIVGASYSLLSTKGVQYATAFEPFRRFLKDVAGGKADLPDNAYYEAYLPYAAVYGFAEAWVKHQAKSDYQQLPAYFRAAEFSGAEMATFVTVIAAASNSGGSAGAAAGAAGAAAAGGGASGAG